MLARARGDGTALPSGQEPNVASPVRAGMEQKPKKDRFIVVASPVRAGMERFRSVMCQLLVLLAPCARGWNDLRVLHAHANSASPVRAGMEQEAQKGQIHRSR